jgi:hypothetical protein
VQGAFSGEVFNTWDVGHEGREKDVRGTCGRSRLAHAITEILTEMAGLKEVALALSLTGGVGRCHDARSQHLASAREPGFTSCCGVSNMAFEPQALADYSEETCSL